MYFAMEEIYSEKDSSFFYIRLNIISLTLLDNLSKGNKIFIMQKFRKFKQYFNFKQ